VNRDLVDAMETATASRRQPLILHITTAGYDKKTICWEKYDYACKVRDGIINDPYFLPVIFETLPEDDWKQESVWKKANPNLGVSVSLAYLKQACKEAQEVPAKENTFRRLHLNQWTEQDSRWLSMDVWNECEGRYCEKDLEGKICYGGLDLSTTTDLSAFVLYFPDTRSVLCYPFAPKENAQRRSKRDKAPYLDWERSGHMTLTEGDVIDYDVIRRRINELGKRFNIRCIAVDRWNCTQITTQLDGDGFNIVPMGQGYQSMTAPTKEIEKMIIGRELRHNNHPALNWCVSNVSVEQDAAGNIKPSKKKSTERIDCVVALINAVAAYLANPSKPSVYETRGILEL
jgi:phage terminase large subunit-like protein